jgi:uncharacterized membrane protein
MRRDLAGLVGTTLTLTVVDLLWLGFFARDFYARALGPLLRPETHWPAAAAFYIFYVVAIWVIAVRPNASPIQAGRHGAAMGGFAYGVYELTNWAVLAGWPAVLVPIDWAWGIFLTGTSAAAGAAAQRRFSR